MQEYLLRKMTIFIIGAFVYGICEIIARGFTHITMGLLGGFAMVLIHYLNTRRRDGMNFFACAMVTAAFITSAEFVAGVILNLYLKMNIWDYSDCPLNYRGQICLPFSAIWVVLSMLGLILDELVRGHIFGQSVYLPRLRKIFISTHQSA